MQSGSTEASYTVESRPAMPDCLLTTERSEEGDRYFLVGKGRIKAPFSQGHGTRVAVARASDWFWSAAAFSLLL
jgi:hypothetical protein